LSSSLGVSPHEAIRDKGQGRLCEEYDRKLMKQGFEDQRRDG